MIKELKYNGYSANPSDYEAPDGELALALGVVNEDYRLQPIARPNTIFTCSNGGKIILIHDVGNHDNYIIIRPKGNGSSIYWLPKSNKVTDEANATYITDLNTIHDAAVIGNTVVLATSSGLRYLLWRDSNYIPLKDRPPFPNISFGLTLVKEFHAITDVTLDSDGDTLNDINAATNSVYGALNPIVASIAEKGQFCMPFFVRYAYRMFDGSHNWASAPILMYPTTMQPLVSATLQESNVTIKVNGIYLNSCLLEHMILNDSEITDINNWKDIIQAIDIFVSKPIYTYDQSGKVIGMQDADIIALTGYFDSNDTGLFYGHYRQSEARPFESSKALPTGVSGGQAIKLPNNENFRDQIKSASLFYKVASIELKDIKPMENYEPVSLLKDVLTNLPTQPTLDDDYQSHCQLIANSIFPYNNRINIADIELIPAQPFALESSVAATTQWPAIQLAHVKVYTRLNGVLCYAIKPQHTSLNHWDLLNFFPRYIFYPDASAYKMEFYEGVVGNTYTIELTPHDFLNGAYWCSFDNIPHADFTVEGAITPDVSATKVAIQNKIYTSEVNDPFYFPLLGINTIGTGKILGLSSAAKALAEGQFGQFPLYAFTDEGVWALEVSATGSFSAKQPITRDLCINPDSITQIDSAVLFATNRGIMLLSGSQTQCISEPLKSESSFSSFDLPGFAALIDEYNSVANDNDKISDTDITQLPFLEFLKECRLVYDYSHQRIIAYNPLVHYAYVYSLKSQTWGMMHSNLVDNINAYPNALAIAQDNSLVDISNPTSDNTPALIITRPFKLDDPNAFKTISTIIQRGMFRSNNIRQVLYGSNDLFSWHTIWSSADKYLRGFSGSPYKYFRLALVCSFDTSESIYGCSVQFDHRLTNKLR